MKFDKKSYMKEYNQKYYLENKNKIKENVKRWEAENPEKVKGYIKKSNNSKRAEIRRKKWIENNPEKNVQCKNKWRKENFENNKEKIYARNKSSCFIELKPCCEICGSTENLQRHHWNYNKSLLVNTLCKECHDIQHVKNFYESRFAIQEEII